MSKELYVLSNVKRKINNIIVKKDKKLPPIAPSQVLFGLIIGAILCLPKNKPKKYEKISVVQTISNTNKSTIHDLTNPKKHNDIKPKGINIIKKFKVKTFLNVFSFKHFRRTFEAIIDVTIDATIIDINREIVFVAEALSIHPISVSSLL